MKNLDERQRLDIALVRRGLASTRSRARDLIARGAVCVDGLPEARPARLVAPQVQLALLEGSGAGYVSRGALKLTAALDHFRFSPQGLQVLDLGASTGGFTEVLLERGATRVVAVVVGCDQLHSRLRGDARVVVLEGFDARSLTVAETGGTVGAITADLSFIALHKALPAALALAAPAAWLIALVKPQFEVGRDAIGKGGIVRREADREAAVSKFSTWLAAQPGWSVEGSLPSPIAGGDGNAETLIGARRHG